MKVNLEHELLERNRKQREQLKATTEDSVQAVKGLLEYNSLEDSKILNSLGINSVNMRLQEGYGNSLVMEKIETATKHTVVHISEIQYLCLKYRLRLLQVCNYVGVIPSDIVQNIKELQEAKRISSGGKFQEFDTHQLKTEFYVMAPAKMFDLQAREKKARVNIFKIIASYFQDPILFYRDSEEHWVIVRKWGSDFSIFRRILGFITQDQTTFFFSLITLLLLVGGCILAYFTTNPFIVMFYIFASLGVAGIIAAQVHNNFYSSNNWRSTIK